MYLIMHLMYLMYLSIYNTYTIYLYPDSPILAQRCIPKNSTHTHTVHACMQPFVKKKIRNGPELKNLRW